MRDGLNDIVNHLRVVQERIKKVCDHTGRDMISINIIAVSKTFSCDNIFAAYRQGIRIFGENKALELKQKHEYFHDLKDIQWIMIGHLQTNKIKYLAPLIKEFHALDSLRLAEKLNNKMQCEGRKLPVFVQVNTSGEDSKYGIQPWQLDSFVLSCKKFDYLEVVGLMTLAIHSKDKIEVRKCFRTLRELRDRIQMTYPQISRLSMGMSGDFEIAIEEGATDIRIGQSIFGQRLLPDSYYWPEN